MCREFTFHFVMKLLAAYIGIYSPLYSIGNIFGTTILGDIARLLMLNYVGLTSVAKGYRQTSASLTFNKSARQSFVERCG